MEHNSLYNVWLYSPNQWLPNFSLNDERSVSCTRECTDQFQLPQVLGKGPILLFSLQAQILRWFQKMTLKNNLMGALVKIWKLRSKFGYFHKK